MTIRVLQGENGVMTVLMDRPDKRNAFTLDMYREFGAAFERLDADDAVRCVIVRGAGSTFCAGSDIGGFDEGRSGSEQARAYAKLTLAMTDRLKNCRHPTLALIEGACVGGGLEIAAMCDIRIAAKSARFGIPINRLGLNVDHQELQDLAALVGYTAVLEILLEGHIFGSAEALSKGLLTRVVDDTEIECSAEQTAQRIADGAPLVNRWHKKFATRLRDPAPLIPQELDEAYLCFESDDYRTGQQAFARKARPVFHGR